MKQHDLALEHCAKMNASLGRFEVFDAFVAGYEAALNELKLPPRQAIIKEEGKDKEMAA